jgi:hypothetical protein
MVMGMVDCVGKELNVGDKVICADSRYADLLIGEVFKLAPQKAWVRYHRSEYGKQYTNEKLKESYQIFKYVEVVRCKDCKHWESIHEHIPHMECQIFCGAYEHGYPTNADDFCSYGERKTDGNR